MTSNITLLNSLPDSDVCLKKVQNTCEARFVRRDHKSIIQGVLAVIADKR